MAEIKKGSWMLVGIFLWGIPTGALCSLVTAFLKPGSFSEIQSFQMAVFVNNCIVFVPLFAFLGGILGLLMFKMGAHHYKSGEHQA